MRCGLSGQCVVTSLPISTVENRVVCTQGVEGRYLPGVVCKSRHSLELSSGENASVFLSCTGSAGNHRWTGCGKLVEAHNKSRAGLSSWLLQNKCISAMKAGKQTFNINPGTFALPPREDPHRCLT